MTSFERFEVWQQKNDDDSNDIASQSLYNVSISIKWTLINSRDFFFSNVVLSNVWKKIIESLSFEERNKRWPASFTFKSFVQINDHEWKQSATMIVNGEEYYMILYDNVQLTENDQDKYKIFRLILEAAASEREIKMISNARVSHDLKLFNNKKKKGVAIFFSRKNIATSTKKGSGRSSKKKRRFGRFQQKQAIFDSDESSEDSEIVMSGALLTEQDLDFSRISSRRKVSIQVPKTRYGLFQSDDEEQTVLSSAPFAGSKKRSVTFTSDDDDDEDSEVRAPTKTFKSAIKQKIEGSPPGSQPSATKGRAIFQKSATKQKTEGSPAGSQLSATKGRTLFQKSPFKRPSLGNPTFTSTRVATQAPTPASPTPEPRNYLQSVMLDQKDQITQLTAEVTRLKKESAKQQQFSRDIARLLAVSTAGLGTMASILDYTIGDTDAPDILNKGRDDIILTTNAQIGVIYKNYKLDMQPAGRKSKTAPWDKFEPSKDLEELCVEGMAPADIGSRSPTPQYLAQ